MKHASCTSDLPSHGVMDQQVKVALLKEDPEAEASKQALAVDLTAWVNTTVEIDLVMWATNGWRSNQQASRLSSLNAANFDTISPMRPHLAVDISTYSLILTGS